MRLAFFTLLFALPAVSAAEGPPRPGPVTAPTFVAAAKPSCSDPFQVRPAGPGKPLAPKRLGELPPADMTLAVVRQVDGCIEPVKVRFGLGR
jgi:hypothetical protein